MSPSICDFNSLSDTDYLVELIINELERFKLLPLNIIYLYLSNTAPQDILKNIAPTESAFLKFLKLYPDLFEIDNMHGISYSKSRSKAGSIESLPSVNGVNIPGKIENGRGKISRLFPMYGFIEVSYPFKSSVYFSSRIFNESFDLEPLDMAHIKIGKLVGFNAVFGQGNSNTPYRATKIWELFEGDDYGDEEEEEERPPSRNSNDSFTSRSSCKSRNSVQARKGNHKNERHNKSVHKTDKVFHSQTIVDSGTHSNFAKHEQLKPKHSYAKQEKSNTVKFAKSQVCNGKNQRSADMSVNGTGTINGLFDKYGFITSSRNNADKIYFGLSEVKHPKNINDLRQAFKRGDVVSFTAVPSMKKGSAVRWQATSVTSQMLFPEDEDICYSSSVEDNIEEGTKKKDFLQAVNKNGKSNKTLAKSPPNSNSSENLCKDLKNCQGKIYPQSDTTAIIKFGAQYRESAEAYCCQFFMCGTRVSDLKWEFQDGDIVCFDAIKNLSNSIWQATLVWQGDKPSATAILLENNKPEVPNEKDVVDMDANSDVEITPNEIPHEKMSESSSKTFNFNWGDSPFPDDPSLVDEGSTESHYSSAESHSSTYKSVSYKSIPKKITSLHNSQNEVKSSIDVCEVNGKMPKEETKRSADQEYFKNNKKSIKNFTKKSDNNSLNEGLNHSESAYVDNESYSPRKKKASVPKQNSKVLGNPEVKLNKKSSSKAQDCDFSESASSAKENGISDTESMMNYNQPENSKSIIGSLVTNSTPNITEDETKTVNNKSGVLMFDNVAGKVVKIYRIHIDIECPEVEKRMSLSWNDLYHKGVSIREKCRDLKALLKPETAISLNFFEITDDSGCVFRKVTLAWIGDKPKNVEEIEPQQFIENENLEVSCEVPTRKNYKAYLKRHMKKDNTAEKDVSKAKIGTSGNQSMRPLNQYEDDSDGDLIIHKKHLSSIFTHDDDDEDDNNEKNVNIFHAGSSSPKMDVKYKNPDEIVDMLFNSIQQLRQLCIKSECLQVIDNLECGIESAIKIFQSQTAASVHPSIRELKFDNASCQTTESSVSPRVPGDSSEQFVHQHKTTASSYMQTIITGDVIAKDIFPH